MKEKKAYKNPVEMKEPWVMDVSDSVFPRYKDTPKGAFLAGNGKDRPQPHVMINECDH